MPITEEKIKYVKNSSDFIRLAQSYGLTFEKKGNDYFTKCPWHKEDTGSLSINPEKRLYHCFGCGAKGNIVQFVQEMEGLAFPQALEKVAGQNLALVEVNGHAVKKANGSNGKPAIHQVTQTREELLITLESAYKHMRSKFVTSPAANHYMNIKRGFEHYRDIEVGYCPTDFGRKLPKEEQDKLIQLGIMRNRRDVHLAACVVFPLRNVEGQMVGLYGRRIKAPGTHYYLPGPREGVFGIHNGKDDTVYITESVIDALSLNEIGVMSVLSLHGVNCFTPVHEQWLKDKGIRTVYLMLDGDKPGREAAVKLQQQLNAKGYVCHKLDLPNDEDPNSFFLAAKACPGHRPGKRGLEELPGYPKKTTISELQLRKQGDELTATMGDRKYTILSLSSHEPSRLKVTIRVSLESDLGQFYIDSPDLYQASARNRFEDGVIKELGGDRETIHGEIKQLITALEKERMAIKEEHSGKPAKPVISEAEKTVAFKELSGKDLVKNILRDLGLCGMIGEEKPKLLGYLGTVSRLLDKPIGVVIISRPGAGKTTLQNAICSFVPEEDLVKFSRITSQALFYKDRTALKYKVLAIEEEMGMTEALYSIKLLQSDQRLTVATARSDPRTGQMRTEEHVVEGPVFIIIATTNPDALDPETRSRFIITTIDESPEQTRRILDYRKQLSTSRGRAISGKRGDILRKHHNMQRLLKPLRVENNIAPYLDYPYDILQTRREWDKYEGIINSIALLHQYQREIKKDGQGEYIEVEPSDIALANELVFEFFPHSIDEMAPHTRRLGESVSKLSKESGRHTFFVKELREYCGWSDYSVRQGLKQLEQLGYMQRVAGQNGVAFQYKMLVDVSDETVKRPSLTSVEEIAKRVKRAKKGNRL